MVSTPSAPRLPEDGALLLLTDFLAAAEALVRARRRPKCGNSSVTRAFGYFSDTHGHGRHLSRRFPRTNAVLSPVDGGRDSAWQPVAGAGQK